MQKPKVTLTLPEPSARQTLAKNIVALRTRLDWSQEDLAHAAGFHRTFIGHVEREARNISLDNIERIAVALGVPLIDLFK